MDTHRKRTVALVAVAVVVVAFAVVWGVLLAGADSYVPVEAPAPAAPPAKPAAPEVPELPDVQPQPEQPQPVDVERDVSGELAAAERIVRQRELDQAPRMSTDESQRRMRAQVVRGLDQGFERIRPELVRLARSLQPELPASERVRILVAKIDELTGWDRQGIVPFGR